MPRETFKIEGLETTLARLRALPAEIVSKNGGPVRAAMRKGAVVIRDEARKNVQQIIDEPNIGGGDESSGLLLKSITVKRGKANATRKGERFFVLVSKRARYPIATKTPSGIGVEQIGRMLEYGTARVRAHPWMGPAFHSKKETARDTIVRELNAGIDRVVRRLSRSSP